MKPAVRALLPAALIAVAGLLLLVVFRPRSPSGLYEAERARLEREFVERAAVGRALPPERDAQWRDEVRALIAWWSESLAALRARHPGAEPRPSPIEAAEKARKGKLPPEDRALYDEWIRYTGDRWTALREGRYAPVLTGSDKGLRLDVLSAEVAEQPDAAGRRAVRLDFALWGAPRRTDREPGAGPGAKPVVRTVVPVKFERLAVRLLDAGGKLHAEMSGSGEPWMKVVEPERWVEDFPPGVLLGTWWIDRLPREAAKAEIEVAAQVTGVAGAVLPVAWRWQVPVRDEWKLGPGEVFEAQTRELPPEDVGGRGDAASR